MKRALGFALILITVLCLAFCYWYVNKQHRLPTSIHDLPSDKNKAIASVNISPIQEKKIYETLIAYGMVTTIPSEAQILSVPFESVIQKVLISEGQVVKAGDPLIRLEPSPDTRLYVEGIMNKRDTAKSVYRLLKRKFALGLATKEDLVRAQQDLRMAEERVRNIERRGIDGITTIRANKPGIVSRIMVQQGQIVSAGSALTELIGEDKIRIRLGIENEDLPKIHAGEDVRLYPVNTAFPKAIKGHVTLITRKVNPKTRLIDVFVTPKYGSHLLLDEYVQAKIIISSHRALVVPRSAVLPEHDGYVLYTVKSGHAVRHTVYIGLENDKEVEIIARGLSKGEMVVTTGNYELSDGMPVKVDKAS